MIISWYFPEVATTSYSAINTCNPEPHTDAVVLVDQNSETSTKDPRASSECSEGVP